VIPRLNADSGRAYYPRLPPRSPHAHQDFHLESGKFAEVWNLLAMDALLKQIS
jgi:hypothetical protein